MNVKRKILFSTLALTLAGSVPSWAEVSKDKTGKVSPDIIRVHPLTKAMEQAYKTNPDLHKAIRSQYSNAEQVPNALAGFRPNLSVQSVGSATKTINDGTTTGVSNIGTQIKQRGDFTTKGTQIQNQVVLSQNLYNGWRTIHNVNAAEHTVMAGQAQVLTAEQTVLLNAAKAYLDLWKAKQTLEFRLAAEKFSQRSYDEVKAQADVGEKTITAVAETEANLSNATAQRILAEATLEAAKATYAQVVGVLPPEDLATPYDAPESLSLPTSMTVLEKEALDKNPDLLQAFFSEKAAEQSLYSQEGTILPTVDFETSGTRNFQKDGAAKNSSQNHWRQNSGRVQVAVKVPLYQSGAEWSAIRKANQDRFAARNAWKSQRRTVLQNVKSIWSQLQASRLNVRQFELAVKAAEVTLEGKRQEYLVGESTLTDMLQAQSNLVQAQASLVDAQNNYYASGYQILALYGNLLPETLYLDVNRYDLKGYEDEVRSKWIGTGDLRETLDAEGE